MDAHGIRLDLDGAVATLTIDRPAVRNALDAAHVAALGALWSQLEADAAVRVVVLTGAGERAFIAGADIGEIRQLADAAAATAWCAAAQAVLRGIEESRLVSIAALNGVALGGGLEVALACDLRLMADHARVGLPEIQLGLIPGWGGSQRLLRLIGPGATRWLCLTGEPVDAAEAARLGIVERVVPGAELLPQAQALAQRLAGRAPQSLVAIKQLIRDGAGMPLHAACALEARAFGERCVSDDGREGTRAFLERRAPQWSGR